MLSPNDFSLMPIRCSIERYRLQSGVFSGARSRRPGRSVPLPRPGQQQRQVLHRVTVAVLKRAAEHDHRIVEQRRAAFIEALQPVQEVRQLLDVPVDDLAVLLACVAGSFAVVRDGMEAALHAGQERVILLRLRVAEHERADARGVGPERQDEDVQHQPHVLRRALAGMPGAGRSSGNLP